MATAKISMAREEERLRMYRDAMLSLFDASMKESFASEHKFKSARERLERAAERMESSALREKWNELKRNAKTRDEIAAQ